MFLFAVTFDDEDIDFEDEQKMKIQKLVVNKKLSLNDFYKAMYNLFKEALPKNRQNGQYTVMVNLWIRFANKTHIQLNMEL